MLRQELWVSYFSSDIRRQSTCVSWSSQGESGKEIKEDNSGATGDLQANGIETSSQVRELGGSGEEKIVAQSL